MTDQAGQAGGTAWVDKPGSPGPNVARIYDYLLGGKDHFAADRQAAQQLIAALPNAPAVARANRAFLAAAVRQTAREGITQYLDVGAGLPTSPNVHECARAIVPGARVAYVDNDLVAVGHARALLPAGDEVIAIEGDAREPEAILASPALAGVIDLAEPVCLLLVSMLHFVTAAEADVIVGTLRQRMVPGSYLVISQGNASPVRSPRPSGTERPVLALESGGAVGGGRREEGGEFGAARHAELGVDVGKVIAHRAHRELQLGGDGPAGQAGCRHQRDLPFPAGEALSPLRPVDLQQRGAGVS